MGITGVVANETPAITGQLLNIIHIALRQIFLHHNLGLGSWWRHHTLAIAPDGSECGYSRMANEHGYSGR